jgi:hypothetical protein
MVGILSKMKAPVDLSHGRHRYILGCEPGSLSEGEELWPY